MYGDANGIGVAERLERGLLAGVAIVGTSRPEAEVVLSVIEAWTPERLRQVAESLREFRRPRRLALRAAGFNRAREGLRLASSPALAWTRMRSDMRTYWRDPGYWRWLWQHRVSGDAKRAIAVLVAVAFGIGGYLSAGRLAPTEAAARFTTQRVVTVVKTRSNAPPEVVTKSQTITRPGETDVVTVRRDGRTVVLRAPGETVTDTVRGPVQQRVVTNARTDTVVQTETRDRLTTVTTPGTTETVTDEVTEPGRTVTETVTEDGRRREVTVTEEVTVTDEVTVTVTEEVTVTVTETDRRGPP